jgi:hypothetical protein
MKYQCSACDDIIESTNEDRFAVCMCESVFIDGCYDHNGKQIIQRSGYLKEGAELLEVH